MTALVIFTTAQVLAWAIVLWPLYRSARRTRAYLAEVRS